MAWTTYQLSLALMMVVTGSINTSSTKWADDIESEGRDGKKRPFMHPFFQASCMFLGEFSCLIVFKGSYFYYKRKGDGTENVMELTKGNRDFSPWKSFIPAMCDMTGTSIMYIGLTMTSPSSFQMFRGSVIIFVGILSVAFSERISKKREWAGILFVMLGSVVVGASDYLSEKDTDHDTNAIITGDSLIIIAQIITATQMVVEEKYVAGLDIPSLQAVGWEGLFGFITLSLLQIPFYYIHVGSDFSNSPDSSSEDAIDAFTQIFHSWQLFVAILGTILSIAFFNFAGISVTKELSATTRMVLDSVRTSVIWVVSLMMHQQDFHWSQLLGFIGSLMGMGSYNNVTLGGVSGKMGALMQGWRRGNDHEETFQNHPADERAEA